MEAYRALRPGSEVPRTTENPQPTRDPKRRLLYLEEWLSLAVTSPRVPTLEDRLPLLPRVEDQRHLRETQRGAARALADMLGQEPAPQRRDSRLAVGKEHRSRQRTTRLRRRQEGSHGRKPHLLVDTEGLVLKALPYTARRSLSKMA